MLGRKLCCGAFAILVLLLSLEMGFRVRGYLDRAFNKPSLSKTHRRRILLVGDSIFGTAQAPGPANILAQELERISPNSFEVIAHTVPGQSSAEANVAVDGLLKEFHPALVVVMLGKDDSLNSDWHDIRPNIAFKMRDVVAHLRIYKLYAVARDEILTAFNHGLAAFNDRFAKPHHRPTQDIAANLYDLYLTNNLVSEWNWFLSVPSSELENGAKYDLATQCLLKIERARSAVLLQKSEAEDYTRSMLSCTEDAITRRVPQAARNKIFFRTGSLLRRTPHIDLAKHFLRKALVEDPSDTYANFELGWQYMAEGNDCKRAIPYFEAGINIEPDRRHELARLFSCLLDEKRFAEGSRYFSSIINRVQANRSLIRFFVAELNDRAAEGNHSPNLVADYRLNDVPEDSDSLEASLWLCRRKNLREKANALFRIQDHFDSRFQENFDTVAYQSILAKSVNQGARVIAMQYPNEPDWPLLNIVRKFAVEVGFLSLRSVLLDDLGKHDVLDVFDADFNHLSAVGSQVAAHALATEIVANFTN